MLEVEEEKKRASFFEAVRQHIFLVDLRGLQVSVDEISFI